MPRQLALLACLGFILYVFWKDRKNNKDFSAALWIPQIWMFLGGSRYVSQWLGLTGADESALYLEGSPYDSIVFFVLIAAGLVVLVRRRTDWGKLFANNWWVLLYFLFGAVSFLWSDFPLVSLKRLFKAFGNLIMALVILTEQRSYEAVGVVLRRLAFILMPLSVLYIKYYPELGRSYDRWSYKPTFTGAALTKNSLGQICLLCGIYFAWALLAKRIKGVASNPGLGKWLNIVFVGMILWLMNKANSATSTVCLLLSASLLTLGRLSSFVRNPRRVLVIAISLLVVCLVAINLDSSSMFTGLVGRDSNLTTRVPMWQGLMDQVGNSVLGVGYESYWMGPRLQKLWDQYGRLHQAHNGYLEVYLNLGLIGFALVVGGILSGFLKVRRSLNRDYGVGLLRLCLVLTVALYNWTESTFSGVSNMWVILLLGMVEVPVPAPAVEMATRRRRSFSAAPKETPLEAAGDARRPDGKRPRELIGQVRRRQLG